MKDDDLIKMGQISVKLASKLTPKDWAKNLTDVQDIRLEVQEM